MDADELRARRLISQRLSPTTALAALASPLDAATWMTAWQGQTYLAGIRALALRAGASDEDVEKLLESLAIVRCWPQRGTLHYVAGADARWLMRLGNPRVEAAAAKRRAGLGIAPEDVETARQVLHDALRYSDEPVTRKDIYALFSDAGIDPGEGRGSHLVRVLGGEGEVVQTTRRGSHERFVHVDKLPDPHAEPADPAVESAQRYVQSRGPVTVADFVWWSGLTVREARRALEAADVVSDGEWFYGAWQRDVTDAELEAALAGEYHLPAFDEYLLAYADKSFALAEELRPRVLTKNGLSWPFVVKGGVVVGREGD